MEELRTGTGMAEARGWEAFPVTMQKTNWGSETGGRESRERQVMRSLIHVLQCQGPLGGEGLGGTRRD